MNDIMRAPRVNSYDIDGVIFLENGLNGVRPYPDDLIITGRSIEERDETMAMLESKGISNQMVFFNQIPFAEKTREKSAWHKACTLNTLLDAGWSIGLHFEDDPLQFELIKFYVPRINVVRVCTDGLIELENKRHVV